MYVHSFNSKVCFNRMNPIYVTIYVDELSGFQEHSYGVGVSAPREYDIPLTE